MQAAALLVAMKRPSLVSTSRDHAANHRASTVVVEPFDQPPVGNSLASQFTVSLLIWVMYRCSWLSRHQLNTACDRFPNLSSSVVPGKYQEAKVIALLINVFPIPRCHVWKMSYRNKSSSCPSVWATLAKCGSFLKGLSSPMVSIHDGVSRARSSNGHGDGRPPLHFPARHM